MIFDTCDICGREMRPQTGPHSICEFHTSCICQRDWQRGLKQPMRDRDLDELCRYADGPEAPAWRLWRNYARTAALVEIADRWELLLRAAALHSALDAQCVRWFSAVPRDKVTFHTVLT